MAQPSSYQRVGATASDYDASAGPTFIRFDGVDDSLASATFPAGTLTSSMDCLIAVRRDSAANMLLISNAFDTAVFVGFITPGNGSPCVVSAGSPTVWVDGTQLTGGTSVTRGTLSDALTVGAIHILEFRGLDLSGWTKLLFGFGYTGCAFNGALGGIQLFASGQDANRTLARAAMAAYFGVTLP